MLDQLESNYDCACASADLHELKLQSERLRLKSELTDEEQQKLNRIENQIHFIRTKCDIH